MRMSNASSKARLSWSFRATSILCALVVASCATVNDALTPSVSVQTDDFDGHTIITQPPVSAASSLNQGWTVLGFDWNDKTPNTIYITVGVYGVHNISAVLFNADGEIIKSAKPVSVSTDYGSTDQSRVSKRRFSMPMEDFLKIATAKDVRMRVEMIDTYTTSKFGKANQGAIVNSKFTPFLKAIRAHK